MRLFDQGMYVVNKFFRLATQAAINVEDKRDKRYILGQERSVRSALLVLPQLKDAV